MKLIRKAISKVKSMPVDLLVYYSDEFNERAKSSCNLESQIKIRNLDIDYPEQYKGAFK